MSYPPSPAQSARQAAKAPLQPHPYYNHHHPSPPSSNASATHKSRSGVPASAQSTTATTATVAKGSKIWSTSSLEERERIKEFWLNLSEDERRNLVKIEKDTVLRKMKEQQKHSCSCAVCGRKRFVPAFFHLTASY
jgi:Salt tolerance down-regulator